jgi:pyruvate dehydrogenase E2 component (dihydrolipoamide acetyltransferase)
MDWGAIGGPGHGFEEAAMPHEVLMPRLSETTDEGILVTWFVEPGAMVREGDLVAEVQVEKMSAEVRAPVAGRIGDLRIAPGGVVAQGAVLVVIEAAAGGGVPATAADAAARPTAAGGPGGPASPAARRLARELDVDLATVVGSGPGGRIVEADIRAAAGRLPGGVGARPASSGRLQPLTPMRRAIAERLVQGLASTAQLTLTAEADVTALGGQLERLTAEWGRRVSYTEAAVRACALALGEHPRVGARWTEDGLVLPERIDIGVAVALDDGLVVPVVRAADRKSLEVIGREIADLAERARTAQLATSETEGGIFSVTNLGGYGIDAFTPLLNPPQTAILGLGRARPRPAVVVGSIEVRMLMVLSLTVDHRVLDGVPAAAFLAAVVRLLQEPAWVTAGG